MDELKTNVLYYGDNLEILRKYIPANSIDLIYLDPPFNSKASYNILFKEPTGELSAAQIKAFSDTWHWDQAAEDAFQDIINTAPPNVAKITDSLIDGLGRRNDVCAYLVMMTIRLVELHRVLKDTGSLYLHCDPTASHYLKLVLDQVFGPANFRNEIIWQRTGAHSDAKRWGRVADTILFYSKGKDWIWNPQFVEYSDEYIKERYKYVDENTGRLYWRNTMTAAGQGTAKRFRGVLLDPPPGTHWRFSQDEIDRMEAEGKIYYSPSGKPYVKSYLDERCGRPIQCIWSDIVMSKSGKERLGYETQKPEALLERIIKASSNEGDVVLDPFCGCGTALVSAQKLNRKWIGIDITHLAIAVMKSRLEESFPGIRFEVVGEPEDLAGAKALAGEDRYQFQWWALSRIKAKPFPEERRKGADKGIDGVIDFQDRDEATGKPAMRRAVVSVKSGHVHVRDIRELKDIASRHAMGVFITLEPPTKDMRTEAVSAGSYHSPLWNKDYPKVQILTIEELLQGKPVDMPSPTSPYAKAPKVSKKEGEQLGLNNA